MTIQKHPKQHKQNWEDLNRHFSKDDTQMTKKHMKRCSASLIIIEKYIKITMRYYLMLVRIANRKKSTNNKCWRGCGKKEISYTIDGNINWYSHYGGHYGGNTNRYGLSSNSTSGYVSGENSDLKICFHFNIHSSTIYNSQDMEAT